MKAGKVKVPETVEVTKMEIYMTMDEAHEVLTFLQRTLVSLPHVLLPHAMVNLELALKGAGA